jgi:hypothetical protein
MATDKEPGKPRVKLPRGRKPRLTVKQVSAALTKAAGIQSLAAERLNVARSIVCRMVAKHDELRLLILALTDEVNDIAEGKLMMAINKGEPWAVKFWLENRGQARGFGQRKLAFKDQQGTIHVPAAFVSDGRMTTEDWDKQYGAGNRDEPAPTIN